jgi:hypothetical protein
MVTPEVFSSLLTDSAQPIKPKIVLKKIKIDKNTETVFFIKTPYCFTHLA